MIILGITHPISINPGAALLVDGNLTGMAEEERFCRIKHAARRFPSSAIAYCLKEAEITLNDVDAVGIGFESPLKTMFENLFNHPLIYGIPLSACMAFDNIMNTRKIPSAIMEKKPIFLDHHICHANSAFYCSPFEEAAVMSMDGTGGGSSGLIGHACGPDLVVYHRINNMNSLGYLYTMVTKMLGLRPHSDESKVMGLASFGTPERNGLPFLRWEREHPSIDVPKYLIYLHRLYRRVTPNLPMDKISRDTAATLQKSLEDMVLHFLKYAIRRSGSKNLCMAGGVSLNCAMNGKLFQSGMVDNIFIQPASWDSGTALGAAIEVYKILTGQKPEVHFTHPYWGPEFSGDYIKKTLKAHGVSHYRRSTDVCAETARLLADNKVVGWFQGRLEIGPRALGNRSILGNPANPFMKNKINKQIKGREPWRPFAPSILEEHVHEYIDGNCRSPFMLMAFPLKPGKQKEIISASHVDNTVRVQTVSRKTNDKYWHLIREFQKLTGIPCLLNTSFNLADEPIVCTPEHALKTFYRCGMDCLVMEDYIIEKKDGDYKGPPILGNILIRSHLAFTEYLTLGGT